MSAMEIATLVVGALAGYWLVSFMFKGKTAAKPVEPIAPNMARPAAWPEVLDLNDDATVDEIRAAYKRLMSQYHPDKVASLGVELQELAERKSKDITAAYQQALAARGQTI
ncbi:MAG TPA: DnaJ domain-containing protein [Burkholderiaceae bacterium]|jgi:DnaJ like chaperone protein